MAEKRGWFGRPFASVCILTGFVILSVYIILNSGARREDGGEITYRITLRHYGIDSNEMERSAALPLEDALSAVPGIKRIVTLSENGLMRAYATFRPGRRGFFAAPNDYYDAVREAAQRVYETLPDSAQRPEIDSSDDSRIPFWTAAVYDSGTASAFESGETLPAGAFLERMIKPALNSIEGVGEIEIAGPGIREIVIVLNQEKTAALGLSPAAISNVLAANDGLFPGGLLHHNGLEIPLLVDGRYSDLNTLGEALIPLGSPDGQFNGAVRLKDIATIREQEREADTLSRLNGKRTAIISVSAASGADPGLLSRRIKKEVEKFYSLPLKFRVLDDRGAEESAAFRSVLAAALQSSLLVAFAVLLLEAGKTSGFKNGFICAGAIPLVCVISSAFLSAAGFPVDRRLLAGLAVGIGGAADAVILGAEGFGRARDFLDGKTVLRGIWPPLVSGAATTVAALLPLSGMADGEITAIVSALGTVTVVSVLLAVSLLPPLFLWKQNSIKREFCLFSGTGFKLPFPALFRLKNIRRRFLRVFGISVSFCVKRPLVFPALSFLVSGAAVLSIVLAGADTAGEWAEDSLYAQIEFEGGFLKGEGDLLLASWAAELKKHPAVRDVQTGARTGAGYGFVTFDPAKAEITEIRNFVRSRTIPGAFIYIPEASRGDRIWKITVSGDDAEKCRSIAQDAASLCSSLAVVKETVLNFKQGGPKLTLKPRREILARGNVRFYLPADTIRMGIHGPVAYKRGNFRGTDEQERIFSDAGETDVRIRFGYPEISGMTPNEDDVLRIPLAAAENNLNGLRVASVMDAEKTKEASVIQRENRRRIASFSIGTLPGDPRFFRDKTLEVLKNLELPPLYRIEFDPEAIREAEALSGKFFSFVWVILFCYMIIAAAEESFIFPLVVLSSILPSLAVPVLLLAALGAPLNASAACAFVAVSGITVNASVISAGELWRRRPETLMSAYRALRGRLPVLLATTGTTIAGVIPFLFLKEGNNALVRTLATVTVLGVAASFLCSLTLVISLMKLFFLFRAGRKIVPRSRGSKTIEGIM